MILLVKEEPLCRNGLNTLFVYTYMYDYSILESNYCAFCFFKWSSDGKSILFGTTSGEVHVYDCQGNYCVS